MTEIQQIRKRLEDIEREVAKPYCNTESLKDLKVKINSIPNGHENSIM